MRGTPGSCRHKRSPVRVSMACTVLHGTRQVHDTTDYERSGFNSAPEVDVVCPCQTKFVYVVPGYLSEDTVSIFRVVTAVCEPVGSRFGGG